ncbi:hypothetical protein DMA11_20375 [Marinilabiliaceae bacterium JC017]|nr:hypothetical protein DMA11_20375 [Marinilabiliaceae bacterium JC017]
MKLFTTCLFYLFILLFSLMPFPILYLFSNFASWVMMHFIKYRKAVIIDNLKNAFPDKSDKELNTLVKKTYLNLIDNLIESLKSFTMRKATIIRRHKILNPELLAPLLQEHKSVIGVTAHYGNWEWGSLSASLQTPFKMAAFYKPIRNKYLNKILRNSRSRCGTELVSIYETSKIFKKYHDEPHVFLMAADQSPSSRQLKNAYWFNFMGRNTAFLHGAEKHARNNNYAVVYIDIQRVKRGFYEVELSLLTDDPSSLQDGEITKMYAQKLESVIKKQPENWLWSHNRWKHTAK